LKLRCANSGCSRVLSAVVEFFGNELAMYGAHLLPIVEIDNSLD